MSDEPKRDLNQTQEHLHGVLSQALIEAGRLVTKWVLITETINDDGATRFISFTSPDLRSWDALGLTTYFEHCEQARTIHDIGEST